MSKEADMRILFLGFTIPEKLMEEIAFYDPFPQGQANKLQWNFINGFKKNNIGKLDILSSLPIFDYPHSPYFIAKGSKFHAGKSQGIIFPYVNVVGLKHISRFMMCSWYLILWHIKYRDENIEKRIILYGLNSAYLLALVFVKTLLKIKVVNIITDIPIDDNLKESALRKYLRSIDKLFLNYLMQKMNGSVVLTKEIARDYIPKLPTLVVEGMIEPLDEDQILFKDIVVAEDIPKNLIVYTGAIGVSYGLDHLVNAFVKLNNDYVLWIFGKGDYSNILKDQIGNNKQIKYWGFVKDNNFVQKVSSLAKILIIPRNPNHAVTKYCFPSKLLEYMTLGVPVITSKMKGIPESYSKYTFMVEEGENFEELLYEKMLEVCSKTQIELEEVSTRASAFVKQFKNPIYQTKKIINFIKNV